VSLRVGPPPRRIRVAPAPPIAPELAEAVADEWRQARAERPALFDGPLFSVLSWDGAELVGAFMGYRHFVAQRRLPELRASLRIRPLAVSGLLECADGIVFGRRGDTTQDAGLWELVPSGGIDAAPEGIVDPAAHLRREAAEELGLHDLAVDPPFAAVEDEGSGVLDIAMVARSPLDAAAILAAPRSAEYGELAVIAPAAVPDFVARRAVAAVSLALLRERGLTP